MQLRFTATDISKILTISFALSCSFFPVQDVQAQRICANVQSFDSDGKPLVPINEMKVPYVDPIGLTYSVGLYGDGSSEAPCTHTQSGMDLALEASLPRHADGSVCTGDLSGTSNKDCRYVFLSISMSNGTHEWHGGGPASIDRSLAFVEKTRTDAKKNPYLAVVDAARGGMEAQCMSGDNIFHCPPPLDSNKNIFDYYWEDYVPTQLAEQNVTQQQVTIVWFKLANREEQNEPDHVAYLEKNSIGVMRLALRRFPNLKIAYLNSRTYGGYVGGDGSPEPFAYEQAFAKRNLIDRQIKSDAELCHELDSSCANPTVPWMDWGTYLWANGTTPNSSGITWQCEDFREDDGQHPSALGVDKFSNHLLDFVQNSPTTKIWYLNNGSTQWFDACAAEGNMDEIDPSSVDKGNLDQKDIQVQSGGCRADSPTWNLCFLFGLLIRTLALKRRISCSNKLKEDMGLT